jgi:hypothetical protein
MPKAIKSANLGNIKATEEELADARKILLKADNKNMKAKMQSMTTWLKKIENSEGNASALQSRGEERKQYLEAWLVHQMRCKTGEKTTEVATEVNDSKDTVDENHWWSSEKMDAELGPLKAQSWRDSGKLPHRPDPISGADLDPFREYAVPTSFVRKSIGEKNIAIVKTVGTADEEDLALVNSTTNVGAASEVQIKIEPLSETEKVSARIKLLEDDPKPTNRKIQDYMMDSKCIVAKATGVKYTEKLIEDCNKHVNKMKAITKILDQMIAGLPYDPTHLPKVIASIDAIDAQQAEIEKWGVRFGLTSPAKKRRK